MKIVCISDTHQLHKDMTIPDGDVLLHVGDFTNQGRSKEIKKFNGWLGKLPHQHKFIIAGNHDLKFQLEPERARGMITNAIYLQDESYLIPYGDTFIKLYGSPWSTPFFPKHWVFNAQRGAELKAIWANIPYGTDILMTHGPAHGYGDRVDRVNSLPEAGDLSGSKDFALTHNGHVGCEDLFDKVSKVKPRLHLCGHIHEDRGEWTHRWGDYSTTTFANVSTWNHNTNEVREPVVYEWDVDI